MERINFDEFAGGELSEKLNLAMEEVVKNMLDVNTPFKTKRGITVKIGFNQNETRDDVSLDISVETKLAQVTPSRSHLSIGKDLKTGKIYAEEYGKQIKGQMALEDFDPETGEIYQFNKKATQLKKAEGE